MREGIKVAFGVLALTIGASAPTLVIESIFSRSIYQTQKPRYGHGTKSSQEQKESHPKHGRTDLPTLTTENKVNAIETKGNSSTGSNNSHQNNPKSEPGWVSDAQWGSAVASAAFTGVLVVVGFLQWRIYKRQATLIGRQLEDTRVFQRAYLSIEPMGIEPFTGNEAATRSNALIGIRNTGNLPATNVRWAIEVQCRADRRWAPPAISKSLEGDNFVSQGMTMRQGSDPITFDYEDLSMFRATNFIYVWGKVEYCDGFVGGR